MKKTAISLSIILALLVLIVSSCKKPEYYYLSDRFKSYTIFPNGTYWVYKNINTGFIDTMTVESTVIKMKSGHAESNQWFEKGYVYYNTFNSGQIIGMIKIHDASVSLLSLGNSSSDSSAVTHNEHLTVRIGFFCCTDTGSVKGYYFGFVYTGLTDSMELNGKQYQDVMKFRSGHDSLPEWYDPDRTVKISYFAKNTGLIKWEMFNGDVWELIDFNTNN